MTDIERNFSNNTILTTGAESLLVERFGSLQIKDLQFPPEDKKKSNL